MVLLIHERDITIFKKSLELGMEIMKSVERLPSVCDILASNPTTALTRQRGPRLKSQHQEEGRDDHQLILIIVLKIFSIFYVYEHVSGKFVTLCSVFLSFIMLAKVSSQS